MRKLLNSNVVMLVAAVLTVISIVIGGIYATVLITLKVGAWYGLVNSSIEAIENIEGDIERIDVNMESVEFTVERVDSKIDHVDRNVARLAGAVTLLTQATFGTADGASPSTLTEFGQAISSEISGKELVREFLPELAPKVKGMHRYDVQELSFNYVYDRLDEDPDFAHKVKNVAYDNALSEWAVVNVLGIELRDALLDVRAK